MSLYYGKHIIAGNPPILSATNDRIGGFMTGYTKTGNNYPVLLDTNSRAFVLIPNPINIDVSSFSQDNNHVPGSKLVYDNFSSISSMIQTQLTRLDNIV